MKRSESVIVLEVEETNKKPVWNVLFYVGLLDSFCGTHINIWIFEIKIRNSIIQLHFLLEQIFRLIFLTNNQSLNHAVVHMNHLFLASFCQLLYIHDRTDNMYMYASY